MPIAGPACDGQFQSCPVRVEVELMNTYRKTAASFVSVLGPCAMHGPAVQAIAIDWNTPDFLDEVPTVVSENRQGWRVR